MRQTICRFLFALILISGFSFVSFSQTENSEEKSVVVPELAMEQVVRRILVYNFKPRKKKKIVYLAEKGLQKSWLPKIEGVEFRLLSEDEVSERESVYFFTKLEKRSPSKYHIGFAFGDPSCSYEGDSWYFRISKERVRLWKPNEGFGAGCGSSSANGYGSLITPQSNKSMDVMAQAATLLSCFLVNSELCIGGFARVISIVSPLR
jgi:hypothetical protein